jgi:hypothetical protein
MSELVLPQTIDAGTPMSASEVQANFVATRDVINGNLEGGAGASGNFKQRGITSRELADNIKPNFAWSSHQPGVMNSGEFKVTPGAGLTLNYASGNALVEDDGGVVSATLEPHVPVVNSVGGSVVVAANASGSPRIDQVILTLTSWYTGTVSVLQGTATGGATLDNRSGAAALPASSIRLADILMPNGFGGPFVQNTHIRDRRQWSRGHAVQMRGDNGGDETTASGSFVDIPDTSYRLEIGAGEQTLITWHVRVSNSVAGASALIVPLFNGVEATAGRVMARSTSAGEPHDVAGVWLLTPTGGASTVISMGFAQSGGGTVTITNNGNVRFGGSYVGFIRQNASNTGA